MRMGIGEYFSPGICEQRNNIMRYEMYYITLFLNISTKHVETFIIPLDKLLKAFQEYQGFPYEQAVNYIFYMHSPKFFWRDF